MDKYKTYLAATPKKNVDKKTHTQTTQRHKAERAKCKSKQQTTKWKEAEAEAFKKIY